MGSPPDIVRFGEFTLDAGTRQLLKARREVRLSPKAFELLLLLVRNRPRAISKTDLHAHLWPDAFVTEDNLFGLVKEIRQALNEDSRQPRFIRTLHGFGYAFGGDAEDVPDRERTGTPSEATCWIVGEGQFRLAEGANILGRDSAAGIWFDRPGVSRRHARIDVNGGRATLEDLGSRNGTWVRGDRVVAPTALQDGDEIRLGPVVVTFRVRPLAKSTEVT